MEKKGQILNFQAISQSRTAEPVRASQGSTPVRLRASRILTKPSDIKQWGVVAEILEDLDWDTGKILISSAKEKEDVVDTVELTAPVGGIAGKAGNLVIGPDSVQYWQDKGSVLVTKRLPTQGDQNQLEEIIPEQTEKVRLIEEVGIFPDQTANPFLKVPADLKKEAA